MAKTDWANGDTVKAVDMNTIGEEINIATQTANNANNGLSAKANAHNGTLTGLTYMDNILVNIAHGNAGRFNNELLMSPASGDRMARMVADGGGNFYFSILDSNGVWINNLGVWYGKQNRFAFESEIRASNRIVLNNDTNDSPNLIFKQQNGIDFWLDAANGNFRMYVDENGTLKRVFQANGATGQLTAIDGHRILNDSNIHKSTSAPTNAQGANGDIWMQYE